MLLKGEQRGSHRIQETVAPATVVRESPRVTAGKQAQRAARRKGLRKEALGKMKA